MFDLVSLSYFFVDLFLISVWDYFLFDNLLFFFNLSESFLLDLDAIIFCYLVFCDFKLDFCDLDLERAFYYEVFDKADVLFCFEEIFGSFYLISF